MCASLPTIEYIIIMICTFHSAYTALQTAMSTEPMRERVTAYVKSLQDEIVKALEELVEGVCFLV